MSKEPTEKKDGTLGKILSYMKPFRVMLIAIVVLSLLGSILNVIVPIFTKNIVNLTSEGIVSGFDLDAIWRNVLLTVAALLGAFLCNLIQSLITPALAQRTAQRMRSDLNDKSNRIPLNYFDTTPEGETLSTMTNDIDTLSTSFSSTLPSLVTAIATLLGCIVVMLITNWVLTIVTIVASILGLLITSKVLSISSPFFAKNQALLAELNSTVNEDIKGILVIKSFNAEKEAMESFDKTNTDLYESTWKSQMATSLLTPIALFSNNLSYIMVCIVGAYLVFSGSEQIGTVIAFISYASLFATPISTISQSSGQIQPALAAHVQFGYVPNHIIVHDFSLNVKPGQKVAIVGPTGAGKSTLINLLTRFYEVNGGDISIDGTSIYDMPRETLHSLISIVLQETWTFAGSIRDNIVYSKEGVTDEQLQQVVSSCGLDSFVRQCPAGLDTILGEEADISAGQKQLITIARAMIDDAPILILDEATSSVDTRTEAIISAAIDRLLEGRTSFVVAHRLSTIRNADMIIVLKDGDVLETGTHDELMAKEGFYADLYMSQFEQH